MQTMIKILVALSIASVIAYAQTTDSTAKQDTSQATTKPAVSKTSTQAARPLGHVLPTKQPTNWSKVKNLFL